MKVDDCLRTLQCDNTATLDDIKVKYRSLSKQYHPDLNKTIDPKFFIELTAAYDYLLLNHIPQKKKKQHTSSSVERFYRIFDGKYPMVIELPISSLEKDTTIYYMVEGIEYRIHLDKGMHFPVILDITDARNKGVTLRVHIKEGKK